MVNRVIRALSNVVVVETQDAEDAQGNVFICETHHGENKTIKRATTTTVDLNNCSSETNRELN